MILPRGAGHRQADGEVRRDVVNRDAGLVHEDLVVSVMAADRQRVCQQAGVGDQKDPGSRDLTIYNGSKSFTDCAERRVEEAQGIATARGFGAADIIGGVPGRDGKDRSL